MFTRAMSLLSCLVVVVGCGTQKPSNEDEVVAVVSSSDPSSVTFGPRKSFNSEELKRATPSSYPKAADGDTARQCDKVECDSCHPSGGGWICSGCKCK